MRRLRLICLITLVAGAFIAAVVLLPHSPSDLRSLILSTGLVAPLIALCAWTLLTPAMVSGALLAGASGLAFGAIGGAAISVAGAVLGGLVAFWLARTVVRTQAEAMLLQRPASQRIHELLERRGFLAMLAARLMPGIPATGLHYAAGVSPVRARAFAAAMAVGAVLRTTPYAVLGEGLGSGSLATIVIAAASVGLGGIAAALIMRRLRLPAPA
jgi:uncharacterized membrane protein YdjX (TVP38/TMEM64 family)